MKMKSGNIMVLQCPVRSKLQASKRYINLCRWYSVVRDVKRGKQPWYCNEIINCNNIWPLEQT